MKSMDRNWVLVGVAALLACALSSPLAAAPARPSPILKPERAGCPPAQQPSPNGNGCIYEPYGSTASCPAGSIADGVGRCTATKAVSCPPAQQPSPNGNGCIYEAYGSTASCPAGSIADGVGRCGAAKAVSCPVGQQPSPNSNGCINEPYGSTASCTCGLIATGNGACTNPPAK